MSSDGPGLAGDFPLEPEHRMLLQMRETLYEGSWDDFERDLKARIDGAPHVFETIPDTPGLTTTISQHLVLIEQMRTWERTHRKTLRDDPASA